MEITLDGLELDFKHALIEALEQCCSGVWGLFGQSDNAIANLPRRLRERLASGDAAKLLELGDEIERLRAELGMPPHELYQRFLEYRRRRDANAPGEPKLARQMLDEIGP
jgi:hypothetical protein